MSRKPPTPRIRPGGVVLTDDVGGLRGNFRDYLAYMRDRATFRFHADPAQGWHGIFGAPVAVPVRNAGQLCEAAEAQPHRGGSANQRRLQDRRFAARRATAPPRR